MIGGGSAGARHRRAGGRHRQPQLRQLVRQDRCGRRRLVHRRRDRTQKIEWIRAGAGERFADIEIEIGAYFTFVTDDASTVEKMAAMFGLSPAELPSIPMH